MDSRSLSYVERTRVPTTIGPKPAGRKTKSKGKPRWTQSKIFNLTLDVNTLRQQVMTLESRRSLLYTRALSSPFGDDGSVVRKSVQYFAHFQRGFQPKQLETTAFVGFITDDDLSIGATGFGRDMLLEQWRRYTAYFGLRRCEAPKPRVVMRDDEAMTCTVRTELTFKGSFTPTGLALVFPAVLRDPYLTQELLDMNLEANVVFHHHYNGDGKMVRHDADTDFFALLAKALGDNARAAEIMQIKAEDTNVVSEVVHALGDRVRANDIVQMEPVAEKSAIDPPEETTAAQEPIEPLEQTERAKRSRFTVLNDNEDASSTSSVDVANSEPDEEPKHGKDVRLTLDFVLSPSDGQ